MNISTIFGIETSGLFVLLVDLLRERSGKKSVNVTKLTKLMGLCFQVRDDLMNLTSSEVSLLTRIRKNGLKSQISGMIFTL